MLFSSITFLYFFLPFVLLLHAFVPDKGKNLVLLLMSLLFYAWGEPVYVFLMLAQILVSYILTRLMEKYNKCKAGRVFLALSVIAPFLALFFFKYSGFLFEEILGIRVSFFSKLIMPIGISFYTFQIVSYNIDVWKKRVLCQKNIITLATYITLFPQLVAGPIVRYGEIEKVLVSNQSNCSGANKNFDFVKFEEGMFRFSIGLGKKVLIANVLGEFVAEVSELSARSTMLSWAYALAVALQIYFDFSGYSDMAIGLGAMLGFDFPENFRYPFISKSISEFWRRWHITLGSWFRDYVYIPLGGNRVGFIRWIFNILVVWMFTGIWHGAGWNFILWGFMFALLLLFEKLISRFIDGFINRTENNKSECKFFKYGNPVIKVIQHLYVVFIIVISFLVFHNTDLGVALKDIQSLWNSDIYALTSYDEMIRANYLFRNRIGILAFALIACTPIPKEIFARISTRIKKCRQGQLFICLMRFIAAIIIFVLSTAYLIDGSFNPFLYFRF